MSLSIGSLQAHTAPTRVLVVDEDAVDRQSVYERLNRPGRRCRQAASLREALSLAGSEPFDVAVMGAHMSADCSVALRQHDPEIGLVMLSDHYSFHTATAAIQVGAAGLITQPYSDAELQAAVENGLRWRKAARANRAALASWQQEIADRTEKVSAAFAGLDVISPPALAAEFKALASNGR
ncbi:MAG TPA: response regulator, partial [Vicinamibacterales bacterium]|nr:response regulator [Vicinamibacterales bacterium]